jgi:hypothetical protein
MTLYEKIRQNYWNAAESAYQKVPHFISKKPSTEDYVHILQLAASVMMTRDQILSGGSFVQSIVNNDLSEAFNRADTVAETAVKFFVYCRNNVYINQ